MTSSPASRSAAAVPPVERISTPSAGQALGEVGDPGLVGDRDQRPAHPDRAVARRSRSRVSAAGLTHRSTTARGSLGVDPNPALRDHADRLRVELVLDRVDRLLELLAVALGRHRHLALEDHRPGVDPLVDEVDGDPGRLDPGLERLADRVEPGEGGQQGGVDVDDAVAEAGDEAGAEQLHVAGEDDEVGAARLDPVGHRRVARRRGRRTRRAGRPRSRPRPPRARSSARAPGLSEPTPTTSIPSRPCSRVEDRLQVGAGARGEDDDAERAPRRGRARRQTCCAGAADAGAGPSAAARARTCRSRPRGRRAGSGR